jgi:hypothetical protein
MKKLKAVLTYPGLWLFVASATYVIARGGATREMLGMLLTTSIAVGELLVSGRWLTQGIPVRAIVPRFLVGIGALALAASDVLEVVVVSWLGSLVLIAGLLLWTQQHRGAKPVDQ